MGRYSKLVAALVSSVVAVGVALGYLSQSEAATITEQVSVATGAIVTIVGAVWASPANTK